MAESLDYVSITCKECGRDCNYPAFVCKILDTWLCPYCGHSNKFPFLSRVDKLFSRKIRLYMPSSPLKSADMRSLLGSKIFIYMRSYLDTPQCRVLGFFNAKGFANNNQECAVLQLSKKKFCILADNNDDGCFESLHSMEGMFIKSVMSDVDRKELLRCCHPTSKRPSRFQLPDPGITLDNTTSFANSAAQSVDRGYSFWRTGVNLFLLWQAADIFFDGLSHVRDRNGNLFNAATGHTPDGRTFYVCDCDADGVYDTCYDDCGHCLGQCQANFNELAVELGLEDEADAKLDDENNNSDSVSYLNQSYNLFGPVENYNTEPDSDDDSSYDSESSYDESGYNDYDTDEDHDNPTDDDYDNDSDTNYQWNDSNDDGSDDNGGYDNSWYNNDYDNSDNNYDSGYDNNDYSSGSDSYSDNNQW